MLIHPMKEWFIYILDNVSTPVNINDHIRYAMVDATGEVCAHITTIITLFAAKNGTCRTRMLPYAYMQTAS